MILKAVIDDQEYTLNVPDPLLAQGHDFFAKLDHDMDQGWQMSRQWVESPDTVQRCQIVADKLLSALEKDNAKVGMLMAAYLLQKMPNLESVNIDIHGEIQNTEFTFHDHLTDPATDQGRDPLDAEAWARADADVSRVFKVGKAYRFSMLDERSGEWRDSPAFAAEAEAERQRRAAVQTRYTELRRPGR